MQLLCGAMGVDRPTAYINLTPLSIADANQLPLQTEAKLIHARTCSEISTENIPNPGKSIGNGARVR
jgi:hypothetical protein